MLEIKDLRKNFGTKKVLKGVDLTVNKGDIISFTLGSYLKAIQNIGKVIMGQTTRRLINKQYTNIKAFVHANRPGIILRKISLLLRYFFDMFFGFFPNVFFVV